MFSSETSDSNVVNPGPLNYENDVSSNITQPCSSGSIRIFLFPPKNKQFRFDEKTNSIEILPLPQDESVEKSHLQTTLTPLVENLNIFSSTPIPESTPVKKPETIIISEELQIRELFKIKAVFQNSKLQEDCFLKGCKWSCDGLCLLSNSEDNVLRLFEINGVLNNPNQYDLEPVLHVKEGGVVYDYAWYPKMNSLDPVTCVFASTSQNSPIHLWDAYTGQLRATYQPVNQYDEVTSAYSLAFSPDGSRIYSGFKKCLRIFDISIPGRISEERNLRSKGNPFQSNIISSICINPVTPSLYALGAYDKTIGIYVEPEGELLCILKGHVGGITQIMFSPDGNYLYSGARKDDEILCWDMRNPGKVVFSVGRKVETQQKIMFDLKPDQNYLITGKTVSEGTTDCNIKVFDVKAPAEKVLTPIASFRAHEDCVNGVQFHPSLQIFASSSGQRHLPECPDKEENESGMPEATHDNSIKLWSYSR